MLRSVDEAPTVGDVTTAVLEDHITPRRVVIVGGGFGGLFAARALHGAPVAVTVVDRAVHHLFQPLLYQCATGILSEGQIARPLRDLLRRYPNVRCLLAEVTDVDPARRTVTTRRPDGVDLELGYDHLIVAAGVRQSYFGHDEFAAHAPGMKTIDDALAIRRQIFGAFELAEACAEEAERRRRLTFALVGAGPTGVELAGQIRAVATRTLEREFRSIDPAHARVLLFEGGDAPLAAFGPTLSARAARALHRLGVELHLRTRVTDVDERGLVALGPDGVSRRYDAGTVLWTAGVSAPPLATTLARATGADQDRAGRIRVEPDLTIVGHPEIVVVGDMMSRDRLPGLAEVAMQSGRYAARCIRHQVEGRTRPARPFRYRDLGSAAYISRGQAVVKMGPLHLSGRLGWLVWLFIHIMFLTGFRNRVGALLSWLPLFAGDVRRERALTAEPTTATAAAQATTPATGQAEAAAQDTTAAQPETTAEPTVR